METQKNSTIIRILIVDDDKYFVFLLTHKIKRVLQILSPEMKIEFIHVKNENDFYELWEKDQNFRIVSMDGCLTGSSLNTIPLIKKIKESSDSLIVGCTSLLDEPREEMKKAGCRLVFNKDLIFKDFIGFINEIDKVLYNNLK
ncbi:MAG: hypothetical protein WCX46_02920 [Candidatus Paceibacterota bacterium]